MSEPFTLKKRSYGKVDGGGEPLRIGQRVKVLTVLPLMTLKLTEAERKSVLAQGGYGEVIAIEPNGVPTFRMRSGVLISGSATRWKRVSHVW